MAKDKETFQQAQQGTGSAEQTGGSRDEQVNREGNLSQQERHDVSSQIDESENKISSIGQTGGLSGRDDYAGGDDNGMQNQSTGEPTERYPTGTVSQENSEKPQQ